MEAQVPRPRAGPRLYAGRIVLGELPALGVVAHDVDAIDAFVRRHYETAARIEDRLMRVRVFLMTLPGAGLAMRQQKLAPGAKRPVRVTREERHPGPRREQNEAVAGIDRDGR